MAASKRASQFEETNENNKALIGEYKDKINTLTGLVNEYKGYSEENKLLQVRLNEPEKENKHKLTEVNRLTCELSKTDEQYVIDGCFTRIHVNRKH